MTGTAAAVAAAGGAGAISATSIVSGGWVEAGATNIIAEVFLWREWIFLACSFSLSFRLKVLPHSLQRNSRLSECLKIYSLLCLKKWQAISANFKGKINQAKSSKVWVEKMALNFILPKILTYMEGTFYKIVSPFHFPKHTLYFIVYTYLTIWAFNLSLPVNAFSQ